MMRDRIRIGTLISGGGTNLQAIIDACSRDSIDAVIAFTGSDNPGAKGLSRAATAGIDTFVVDYPVLIQQMRDPKDREALLPPDFDIDTLRARQALMPPDADPEQVRFFLETRAAAEHQLLEKIRPYGVDLLVLAGFMRVLTPYFIDRFNGTDGMRRILNIHPALLPAFPGTDGYGDTFRYGCRVGGCTVHFVDYGEDTGPIIGQRAFQIEADDTLADVKKKGLAQEWQLYPACIQKVAEEILAAETSD